MSSKSSDDFKAQMIILAFLLAVIGIYMAFRWPHMTPAQKAEFISDVAEAVAEGLEDD